MSLPGFMVEALVRDALAEDLGDAGDITSAACVPEDAVAAARFVGRDPGVIAGLGLAEMAFRLVEPRLEFITHLRDGDRVAPGQVIAEVRGPARGVLTGERVALNFLGIYRVWRV